MMIYLLGNEKSNDVCQLYGMLLDAFQQRVSLRALSHQSHIFGGRLFRFLLDRATPFFTVGASNARGPSR